jgi:hypothetical protein
MLNTFLLNEVIPNTTPPPSYFHYCSDGSYRTLSKNVNHSFVIARDLNDGFIFGQEKDNAELGLVGERLDFKLLPSLDTQEEAEAAAAALQVEARLKTSGGYIVASPHCGMELWDVIRIYDGIADRAGRDFRISAIGLDWHSATGRYYNRLLLGAV